MQIDNSENSVSTILDQRYPDPASASKLVSQGLDPLLASLFSARGVSDISEVRGRMEDILPTASLKNCDEMASILADCVVLRKRVLIVCDYDCDGATAGAIFLAAFRSAGMDVDILVPDRKKHGYGLAESLVLEAAQMPVKPEVIITVDSGISSNAGVDLANSLGVRVLITDHHPAPEILPNAELIVNPNQPDCGFASKNIAGCGVAWYVAKALADELLDRNMEPGYKPAQLLQFLAIGTVADVVALDRNNRILVSEGLRRIRSGECTEGIKALMVVSEKRRDSLNCSDIGFGIAPRLNAAGRLAHMEMGVKLLLTMRPEIALDLAQKLDTINKERKEIEKNMTVQAEMDMGRYLESFGFDMVPSTNTIVVYGKDWHEGVVGIVASRIKEDKHRPTFVVCEASDGSLKASGRSIPGFHLKHALDQIAVGYPNIIVKHGGHPMAVGLTIAPGKLEDFKCALEEVSKHQMTPKMLQRVLAHDGELTVSKLNLSMVKALNREVWGQGFPEPTFMGTLEVVGSRAMGDEKQHLKIDAVIGEDEFDVVAFGEGARSKSLPSEITVLYKPKAHHFNDEENVQLMVEHFPNEDLVKEYKRNNEKVKSSEDALNVIDRIAAAQPNRPRPH